MPNPTYVDERYPLSELTGRIIAAATNALDDPIYMARLEQHYALAKHAAADPSLPAYETLHQAIESDEGWLSVQAMDALLSSFQGELP